MPILLIILNAFIIAIAFVLIQSIVRTIGFGGLVLLELSLPILVLVGCFLLRLVYLARAAVF